MSNGRPAIPARIKRAVRQRCCFGCVICGSPIYHYDHIVEYAKVPVHEESNITLLCSNHHDQKTRRILSVEAVREADAHPFNLSEKLFGSLRVPASQELSVRCGTNEVFISGAGEAGECVAFMVNGQPFIVVHRDEQGETISARFTDAMGLPVANIVRGELTFCRYVWDHTSSANRFVSRTEPGQIALDFTFSVGTIDLRRGWLIDDATRDGFLVTESAAHPCFGGSIADVTISKSAMHAPVGFAFWNQGMLGGPKDHPPAGFFFLGLNGLNSW